MEKVQEPSVYAGSRAFFIARDIAVTLFFETRSILHLATAMTAPASHLTKEGRWCGMGTFEILSLLFLGGTFLIALLTYIDRHNKK